MRLKAHPHLSILPALTRVELEQAAERVRLYGQREPVEVLDGKIVGGHTEYLACMEAGVKPTITRIKEPPACLVEYVVRRNVPRHLSTLDRACIAVLAQEQYKKLGKERMAVGGKLKGRLVEGRGESARPFSGERWFEQAANMLGTKAGAVKKLARIRKVAPDVFAAVRAREIVKLLDAARLAFEVKDEKGRTDLLRVFNTPGKPPVPMARLIWNARREAAPSFDGPLKGRRWVVFEGPMDRQVGKVPERSVDAVYADLVYGRTSMVVDAGRVALRVLRAGGVMVLINGNDDFTEGLTALRDLGIQLLAVGSLHMPDSRLRLREKVEQVDTIPLWFVARKGEKLATPIRHLHFNGGPKEKTLHAWQKSLASTFDLVSSMAPAGSRILDPCCGSATSGVAALQHDSEWIGFDIDPKAVGVARHRLAQAEREQDGRQRHPVKAHEKVA